MDMPPDPIAITPLGPDGVMLDAHHLAHLIQQFELEIGNKPFPWN
jgi:hypothetical protein